MTNLADLMAAGVQPQKPQATPVTMPKPAFDPVPDHLPPVFRVESLERYPAEHRQVATRAVLFHEKARLTVEWLSHNVDVRITRGTLVSVRWLGNPTSHNGAIRISRLVLLERAEADLNLFETVPHSWVKDRALVKQAAELVDGLPRCNRHLFNAIFWDGGRFERYVTGPSSINGHHNGWNGNLRHSVEVADMALQQGRSYHQVYAPILCLGGLLHDAGKADEYRYDHARRRFVLTKRGELIGHRQTLLEWLATARAQPRVIVPEPLYLALVHALMAVNGAPDWLGLRVPRRLEPVILSRADGISSTADLFERNTAGGARPGKYHPHLGVRPVSIGELATRM
jgi:3'-5' exoribonuclease